MGTPCVSLQVKTLTSIHEDEGSIPGLSSVGGGSGVAVSCGVGRRHGLDPVLLWLWWRPAAVALIGPLAWSSESRIQRCHMLWYRSQTRFGSRVAVAVA